MFYNVMEGTLKTVWHHVRASAVVSESQVGRNALFVQPATTANNVRGVSLQPAGISDIQGLLGRTQTHTLVMRMDCSVYSSLPPCAS